MVAAMQLKRSVIERTVNKDIRVTMYFLSQTGQSISFQIETYTFPILNQGFLTDQNNVWVDITNEIYITRTVFELG